MPVQGIRTAVAIDAGDSFSVAALADGTVMTWGQNASGSLGRGPWNGDDNPHPGPAPTPGVAGIRAVVAGTGHVLALTGAGTVVSWGWDAHGQTRQGVNAAGGVGHPPRVLKGLAGVHSVAAQGERSLAVLDDGRILVRGLFVPEWDRPGGYARDLSPAPMLLKMSGLSHP